MRAPRPAADAWDMPRRSSYCGQYMAHSGWYPDRVTRLFRRGARPLLRRPGARAPAHRRPGRAPGAATCCTRASTTSSDVLRKLDAYSTAGARACGSEAGAPPWQAPWPRPLGLRAHLRAAARLPRWPHGLRAGGVQRRGHLLPLPQAVAAATRRRPPADDDGLRRSSPTTAAMRCWPCCAGCAAVRCRPRGGDRRRRLAAGARAGAARRGAASPARCATSGSRTWASPRPARATWGRRAAQADYIVFMDGDCVPNPRFVEQHARLARRGISSTAAACCSAPPHPRVRRWQNGFVQLDAADWLRCGWPATLTN